MFRKLLWVGLGLLAFLPASQALTMVGLQAEAWAWVVGLAAPDPILLVASGAYPVLLLALTGWYWIWRTLRFLFAEGSLPRFRNLLVVLWAPVWFVPVVVLLSLTAWLGCLYKAHQC